MNTKISIACILYMSCQQTRPISSSRIHRISTKLSMQHHIYLLSSMIVSFYILTPLLLCYMFSKDHIMLIQCFFSVTSQCMLIEPWKFFAKKKHLNFYFKKRNHFKNELTRPVINTRFFTTLKSVAMIKIIEFYWFMYSTFCGWMHFKKFYYMFFGRWFCWWHMVFKMVTNTECCEL